MSTTLRTSVQRSPSSRRILRAAALTAAPALAAVMSLAPTSRAANLYWDLDSIVPGAGAEAPSGTWDAGGFVWNDAADGGVGNPTGWIAGSTAVFSAGTNATGTFTIDVQGPHAAAGLIFEEGIVTLNNTQIDLSTAQVDVSTGASAIINTALTGASGLSKGGAGALTLAGTNTITGATSVSGTLTLDFTTNNTAKLDSAGALTLGGTLNVLGANGAGSGTLQSVNGLTLTGSTGSSIVVTKGDTQNATLALGGITRNAAAIVNFGTGGVGAGTASITTSATNTNGIIGGYATYGGSNWATSNAGTLAALSAYAVNDFSAAANNVDVTANTSPAADVTVNSIRFNAAASVTATLSGTSNVIGSGGILAGSGIGANAAALTGGNITSGSGELIVHVHNTAADFTIGSNIVGAQGLTKGGPGTLVLGGTNTYTGTNTILGGTVAAADAGLGDVANGVVMSNDGEWRVTAGGTSARAIALQGNGGIENAANVTLTGIISGEGRLTKSGAGVLRLGTGVGQLNTWTGGVTVTGGVLQISGENSATVGNPNPLGTYPAAPDPDNIVLDGGTLRSTSASTAGTGSFVLANRGITIGSNGGTLETSNANANIQYAGRISGSGRWFKTGPGMLRLTAATANDNTFTGGFTVLGGILEHDQTESTAPAPGTPRGSGAEPANVVPDWVILDGGALKYGNTGVGSTFLSTRKGITLGANGGALLLDGSPTDPAINTSISIYYGKISAAAGTTPTLIKRGHGEIRGDKGTSSEDEGWDQTKLLVEEGLFRVGHFGEEGIFGKVPATYLPDAIRLDGRGTTRATGAAAIGVTSGTDHNAVTTTPATRGIFIEANGGTFCLSTGGNSWVIESIISGPGGLHVNGNGFPITPTGTYGTPESILVFKAANTYGGATNVNVGTLVAQQGASIPDTSAVILDPAATLTSKLRIDNNETIGSLAGGNATQGVVELNSANLTLGADNTSTTFDGLISGGGGITKIGSGTQTLTRVNTYTGATSASGGTLRLTQPLTNSPTVSVSGTGTIQMAPNGANNNLIRAATISAAGSGRIDLTDNKLITSSPAGTFVAGAYTGISGLVDSGRGSAGNALWDGSGIVTSDTRAINNGDLVSIGVAKTSDVRTVADTATTTFAGQTVLGSDTLVMVTWGGDANLDGKINIDDYGRIDGNVGQSGSVFGWSKGDFNYDGKINIDDYGIIDGNINRQGTVFATAGGAGGVALDGVAAVPEPASLSLLAVGAASLLRRRRRH